MEKESFRTTPAAVTEKLNKIFKNYWVPSLFIVVGLLVAWFYQTERFIDQKPSMPQDMSFPAEKTEHRIIASKKNTDSTATPSASTQERLPSDEESLHQSISKLQSGTPIKEELAAQSSSSTTASSATQVNSDAYALANRPSANGAPLDEELTARIEAERAPISGDSTDDRATVSK